MDLNIRLEVQNRTPFPLTWAHLERRGRPTGEAPRNLLPATLPPHRGIVLGGIEAGSVHLVCGFHTEDHPEREHVVGPRLDLGPDDAWSACVGSDEKDGFTIRCRDAKTRAGDSGREGRPAGPYEWNGRRGRSHLKRERPHAGDRR